MTGGEPQQIPDLWEPLAKLAWWIRHVYGLEGGDVIRYVVLALRRGPHLRIVWPHGPKIVQGSEWDKIPRRNVRVNWVSGHLVISDPDDLDNPLQQFPIEAEWEAVIDAVSDWKSQQRNAAAFAARALAPTPKPANAPEASPVPSKGAPPTPSTNEGSTADKPASVAPTVAPPRKRARRKRKASKKTKEQIVCDKLLDLHNPDEGLDIFVTTAAICSSY